MQINRVCSVLVIFFMLSSCAGLFIRVDARKAFENGLTHFNQGDYKEAIPYFRRATEVDPDFSDAYLYLGRAYLNLGEFLKAIPPLRTAFRLAPGKAKEEVVHILLDALFGAALSELKKGNFQGSIDYLREALTLNPQFTKARDELSRILIISGRESLSEGDISGAIAAFSEVTVLRPDSIDGHIGLARAFLQKGNILKAFQELQKVSEIDPSNREAQSLFKEILRRR
jgi:tetratricopeptide (TPR) repeat protein